MSNDTKRVTHVDATNRTVTVKRFTKPEAGAIAVECNWTFDYAGVSEDDMLTLATQEMVIRQQSDWRKMPEKDRSIAANADIDVVDFLSRERAAFVPTAKSVAKQASKLSPEERAALLKELQS